MTTDLEREIRDRLGIPEEAERVILFSESSHWDPNWLFTSRQYYRLRIKSILDKALDYLEQEPARVYTVECVFFLQMYWDREPGRQEQIRGLVNGGRLRLAGGGVTTPDTILPTTEAIIRDYLVGREWLRQNGMDQDPRMAYLPDDFGHSPALPSVLAAMGYDKAAVSRVDGMFFPGSDYRSAKNFPLPGSTAELLGRDLKTRDFFWVGPDGAEVLCHWNKGTYFEGDMLAHSGPFRWMGMTFGLPARSDKAIARKIERFAAEIQKTARTPYLLCPIGCDFADPLPGLTKMIERYNRHAYPSTGLWAANAGMDDYLELARCHARGLPRLRLDPNPYWMGFYASRPGLKQSLAKIQNGLAEAEKLAVIAGLKNKAELDPNRELAEAWRIAVTGNHHDFITGTSPDRVWRAEQKPWLQKAEASLNGFAGRARKACPPPPVSRAPMPLEWSLSNGRLRVESIFYEIEMDERAGGSITRWRDSMRGAEALRGPGNDLVCRRDSGGLWRLGHEYAGGEFNEVARSSELPAAITARETGGVLAAEVRSMLCGRSVVRRLWFKADAQAARMQVEGHVARGHTVSVRFPGMLSPQGIDMDVPGGVASRPLQKIYNPTFWCARSFAHARDARGGEGIALYFNRAAAVSADSNGVVEAIALRNAPMERAFKVLPVPAHPARGTEDGLQTFDYALRFTPEGDWRGNQLYAGAGRVFNPAWAEPGAPDWRALSDSLLRAGNEEVTVAALKPAHNGEGYIVRLHNHHGYGTPVEIMFFDTPLEAAWLCDALERDLEELEITEDGTVMAPLDANIVTLRLVAKP